MVALSAATSRHIPAVAARPYNWSFFNIHPFSFTGVWNNQTYHAEAWLRLICVNQTTSLARMVVSLHSAPFITVSPEGVHSLVPPELFDNSSSLPQLWFQSIDDDVSVTAGQLTNYDELIKRHEDAAQLIYGALLPAELPFTLRMQGSERVHMVQRQCGPAKHPLFADKSAWLGMMDATTVTAYGDYTDAWATHNSGSSGTAAALNSSSLNSSSSSSGQQMDFRRRGEVLRFLTLQHLQHHRALGFAGSLMVVTRHTAEAIMASRPLRRAMQRQRLVLVLWDLGLEPRASHFMQVPAYNLMRLAAWGSEVHLGFWDLDEYLVLPSHKSISEEIHNGCLSRTLGREPEAIVPTMWVSSNSWNATPELEGWMRAGYWSRAVQDMDYAMWPYTFCDGACKSLVDPTTDLMFQVHQHARPPPRRSLLPISWRCGYLLHFYQLWSRRMPGLMAGMGYKDPPAIPGIPLIMEDILPQSALQRLASMAKLYKEIIASNPSLQLAAEAAAPAEVAVQQRR
ncbi:hypothetical protein OEZ86_011737 [Tetradesmus obliquus]|nr:hypothetical protein OEZ86_011737 [Tetradesmus obliquus]